MWGAEMGVNEMGVAICNEAVWNRLSDKETDLVPRLLGMDLLRFVVLRFLRRCMLCFTISLHRPTFLCWVVLCQGLKKLAGQPPLIGLNSGLMHCDITVLAYAENDARKNTISISVQSPKSLLFCCKTARLEKWHSRNAIDSLDAASSRRFLSYVVIQKHSQSNSFFI